LKSCFLQGSAPQQIKKDAKSRSSGAGSFDKLRINSNPACTAAGFRYAQPADLVRILPEAQKKAGNGITKPSPVFLFGTPVELNNF
jgi:hypothetical protein